MVSSFLCSKENRALTHSPSLGLVETRAMIPVLGCDISTNEFDERDEHCFFPTRQANFEVKRKIRNIIPTDGRQRTLRLREQPLRININRHIYERARCVCRANINYHWLRLIIFPQICSAIRPFLSARVSPVHREDRFN